MKEKVVTNGCSNIISHFLIHAKRSKHRIILDGGSNS